MAEHTRKLHFKDSGNAEHTAQLYTAYGDVVPPEIQLNADGTTGGITLYTTGNDTNYPALRVKDGNDTVFGALVDPQDGRASNLHCEYQGTEYAVAEQVQDLSPVGICLAQTGGGSGTWARVDENGNQVTRNIDFDTTAPWSGIHDVIVDGQAMVYIPKFYIKTGKFSSGPYNGKKYWLISSIAKDGYRIHPAFVVSSIPKNGFYIASYPAYNNNNLPGSQAGKTEMTTKTVANASQYCTALGNGFHLRNIYEYSAIQFLMLVEFCTPNVESMIGLGSHGLTGESLAKYRGICDLYGFRKEFVDGFYTTSAGWWIFSNQNNNSYVKIRDNAPYMGGNPIDVLDSSGTYYNLGDVFLSDNYGSENTGTFRDLIIFNDSSTLNLSLKTNVIQGDARIDPSRYGIFSMCTTRDGANDSDACFRFAKYDI